MEPAERDIWITIPSTVAADYAVVDTAWCLSQINRRAYRQGYEYAYESIELFQTDAADDVFVTVARLPNTWVTVNAWTKAYHAWKDQQDQAMEDGDTWSMRAKYRDFKVCYNSGHSSGDWAGGTGNVTQPTPHGVMTMAQANAIDSLAAMDWSYSQFVVPNNQGAGGVTEEYLGHMIGDDTTVSKGLILAYAESRARPHPQDPSTMVNPLASHPDGGLFTEMIDVGEDMLEIVENIRERNNSPPYIVAGTDSDDEFYPGGANSDSNAGNGIEIDILTVRGNNLVLSSDRTGPCTALCGLLWFENSSEGHVIARVRVAPGPYQGVLARPMSEAN